MWLGKIYTIEVRFASINGKSYDMTSAKSLNSILLQSGTPLESRLAEAGFTNVSLTANNSANAKKLASGRGDTWLAPVIIAKWIWKKENLSGKLTFGPVISTSEQWMVMSPGSDKKIAEALKKGLEAIKSDGTFDKILDKYINQ